MEGRNVILFHTEFALGEIVYLKTDEDQLPRIIIGIEYCLSRTYLYRLSQGSKDSYHYEQEIAREKNLIVT